MSLVYHASNVAVECPDTRHSRNNLDFGRGFYLTTLREQAVKYAERFLRRGAEAYLNVYELSDELDDLNVKRFDAYSEDWLDFVVECRKQLVTHNYDIVIGGIANDKVFRTIDLYFDGDITKSEALKRLAFEQPNMQLCIASERVLSGKLKFIESIKL